MEFIENLEFSNKNTNTIVSNSTKTTKCPEQNDDFYARHSSNREGNSSNIPNMLYEKDISENSINASVPNKIAVALSNAGEDLNENVISNSNKSISNDIPDECIDIEEFMQFDLESYLDINVVTKIRTEGGNASRLADNNKSVIENNGLADLEVDNNKSCSGNSNEGTNNIYLADASKLFEGIGNDHFILVDGDDVKTCTKEYKQDTNIEIKNECPLIESENKEVLNNLDQSKSIISISSDEDCTPIEEATKDIKSTIHQNSDEALKNYINWDSDCSGYHSSDFEFITESEAELESMKTNSSLTNNSETGPSSSKSHSGSCYTGEAIPNKKEFNDQDFVSKSECSECYKDKNVSNSKYAVNSRYSNDYNNNRPTTSSLATANSSNLRYNFLRHWNRPGPSSSNNIALDNHRIHNAIPDGEQYFDLFRGIYAPDMPLSAIYMMENKSVRTTSMNVEFEGIGFDMRLMRNFDDSSQEEYEDEAQESVEKILNMYPENNSKRRRRH